MAINPQFNVALAPFTTLKIGGPADIFYHTHSNEEFIGVLKNIKKNTIPNQQITILGNGSNVLISDKGIRGIVIKNSSSDLVVLENPNIYKAKHSTISSQRMESEPDKYLDFTKLDYDESENQTKQIKVSSGYPLPLLINKSFDLGLTGLQWFGYIPGTIGGAVWYNIHGGSHHISEYIDSIEVFDLSTSTTKLLLSKDLSWGYDSSFFQLHPEIVIVSVTLRLFLGDVSKARAVTQAWITQKSKVQPMNSAGSIFQNPKLDECIPIWGEQKSTGWIIDHELNWKGKRVGDAQIGPEHANIFTNQGKATATDFKKLIDEVQSEVKNRFNLVLKTEVKLLGEF